MNTEEKKQYKKRHYEENKEIYLKRAKNYRENNPEKIKKYRKNYHSQNKERLNAKSKKYYNSNKEKSQQYREKNKIKIKTRSKEFYNKNSEKMIKKSLDYYKNNKEKQKSNHKKWNEQNKIEVKVYQNKYLKKKRNENKNYNLLIRLRNRLRESLNKYSKSGKIMSSQKYGINYKLIIEFLKPIPKDLENYDIHHKKPLYTFNFEDEEEIKKAFAPENHQLLLRNDHRKTFKRIDKEVLK